MGKESKESDMMSQIMTVKEFNNMARSKYDKAVERWKSEGGVSGPNPIPFLGTYIYQNQNTGEPKKTGYVGITEHGSVWARTKKEVRKKLNKVI